MTGHAPSPASPQGALTRLTATRPSLSETERRVVDAIGSQPDLVLNESMLSLARRCEVSDTTVLRVCRKAGFAGFTELKLRLAQDLAEPSQLIHDDVTADDGPTTVAHKVFAAAIGSLRDTLEILENETFTAALDLLEGASRILIGGVGGSGPVAQSFYQKCHRIGIPCDAPTDSTLLTTHAALLDAQSLAIAVSTSGATKSIALMLEQARASGAATLVITGNPDSPIAALGDVVLQSVSHETRSEQLAARACQIALLDALYVAYSLRHMGAVLDIESRIIDSVARGTF